MLETLGQDMHKAIAAELAAASMKELTERGISERLVLEVWLPWVCAAIFRAQGKEDALQMIDVMRKVIAEANEAQLMLSGVQAKGRA